MRIGLICNDYPGENDCIPSGISVYTKTLAQGLQCAGHEVVVIESDQWGHVSRSEPYMVKGVPVRTVRYNGSPMGWSMSIHEALLELNLDVVECHNLDSPLFLESMVGGTPVVVRSASSVLDNFMSGNFDPGARRGRIWTDHLLEMQLMASADLVFAASEEVGRKASAMGARAVKVVPLGIPSDVYATVRDPDFRYGSDLVISVSRFNDRRKGGDLVDMILSHTAGMDLSVVVLGEMRNVEARNRLAERFSDVTFLYDPLPRDELLQLYANTRMVLVPSRSESFGLSILEPMAVGTPVATFAMDESKRSWPLVCLGEPDNFCSDVLRSAIAGAEESFGSRVRMFADKFRIDTLIPQYVEGYSLAICRAAVSGKSKRW